MPFKTTAEGWCVVDQQIAAEFAAAAMRHMANGYTAAAVVAQQAAAEYSKLATERLTRLLAY